MRKTVPFDITEFLDSQEAIADYLSQVSEDGDQDEMLRALGHIAKAKGMSGLSEETGLGRESLYKALKPGASPQFSTVLKITKALGFKMIISKDDFVRRTPQKAAASKKRKRSTEKSRRRAALTA
jgi:probable addiction module antidote protein